jgi:hypothetical protein
MNKETPPPCALEANAKESDSVEALQLDNAFPENRIDEESRLTKPTRQFALTNETAVNPIKKLMPPPLTSAPLLRPKAILPLALHRTMELFDTRKLLRVTSVLPIVLKVEMRVNPEEPANKLIPPPFTVDPKVVADVYNRT